MNYLAKIYAITPIRIGFKLVICTMTVKVFGDLFYWATAGMVWKFPRLTMQHQAAQHFLNPPVLAPYPIELQAKNGEQFRKYQKYTQNMFDIIINRPLQINKIYKNIPERQNPDQIDHFMQYCQASRILDGVYSKILKKMSNNGITIPQGINQKIRQLSQFNLDKSQQKIIPHL